MKLDIGARLRSNRMAGLMDQAGYSLASFVQTVLYARLLPADAFGLFAMVLSTVLLAQTLQRCMVVLPMVVSLADRERGGIRGWLQLNAWVLLGAVLALLLAAAALHWWPAGNRVNLPQMLGLAACALPAVFAFEFVRRALYAEQLHRRVPLQAAVYFSLQLGGAWWVSHWLPQAWAAVLVLVVANLLAAAVGAAALTWRRRDGEPGAAQLFSRYRTDMGWSLAAAVPYAGYSTGMPLIVGLLLGPAAAGVFTATRLLLAPVTTLISAVDSVDKPKAARSLRDGGTAGLARSLRGTARSLLLLGGGYVLAVALFYQPLLVLMLGPKMAAAAQGAWVWLLVGLLMMLGQPMETGLLVLRRTRWNFLSRLAALCASLAVLWLALHGLGQTAGVVAVATGWLVSTLSAAWLLRLALRRHVPAQPPAAQA